MEISKRVDGATQVLLKLLYLALLLDDVTLSEGQLRVELVEGHLAEGASLEPEIVIFILKIHISLSLLLDFVL